MRYLNLSILLAAAVTMMLLPTSSHAASNEAPNLVQQGIEAFNAKQYEAATKSFEAALKVEPDDPRILFNLGCVKSAQGQYDEAVKLLQDAALTDDVTLAVKCRYNLGQIAVDRAKAALGEKPEDAKEEARATALQYVNQAIIDYSTCLEMNPNLEDSANARHNLELLRIWQRNMEQTWKEKDRQARRESMDLPKFVDWLDKEQRSLRQQGGELEKQRKSPMRRLALEKASKSQLQLSEEIDPLKQKITNMLSGKPTSPQQGQMMPGAQPGMTQSGMPQGMMQQPQQPAISPEQREQITKALHDLAETASESMTTASQYLGERMFDDASTSQGKSIEQIDQIGAVITPYPELVKKALAEQRQLASQDKKQGTVEQRTEAATETRAMDTGLTEAQRTTGSGNPEPMREFVEAIEEEGDLGSATTAIDQAPIAPNVSRTDVDEQPSMDQPTEPTPEPFDAAEAAWQQRFVERWSQLIIGKAEQGLKNLPPEEPGADKVETENELVTDKEAAPKEPAQLSPEEQAAKAQKEKIEGLRESMRRAVELGPKVVRLTKEAANFLDDKQVDQATPRQEEAMQLLEKIAEPLKDKNQQNQQNQDQQQQQQNQEQQKQNQDQKNQQNKDQQNKDQQNQDQKNQQDKKKDDQKKDDKDKKDQKDKDKDKGDKEKQPKPKPQQGDKEKQEQKAKAQPRDVSKRQAEAMIRKVKERQHEAEKLRELIKAKAYGNRKVEKDW